MGWINALDLHRCRQTLREPADYLPAIVMLPNPSVSAFRHSSGLVGRRPKLLDAIGEIGNRGAEQQLSTILYVEILSSEQRRHDRHSFGEGLENLDPCAAAGTQGKYRLIRPFIVLLERRFIGEDLDPRIPGKRGYRCGGPLANQPQLRLKSTLLKSRQEPDRQFSSSCHIRRVAEVTHEQQSRSRCPLSHLLGQASRYFDSVRQNSHSELGKLLQQALRMGSLGGQEAFGPRHSRCFERFEQLGFKTMSHAELV